MYDCFHQKEGSKHESIIPPCAKKTDLTLILLGLAPQEHDELKSMSRAAFFCSAMDSYLSKGTLIQDYLGSRRVESRMPF